MAQVSKYPRIESSEDGMSRCDFGGDSEPPQQKPFIAESDTEYRLRHQAASAAMKRDDAGTEAHTAALTCTAQHTHAPTRLAVYEAPVGSAGYGDVVDDAGHAGDAGDAGQGSGITQLSVIEGWSIDELKVQTRAQNLRMLRMLVELHGLLWRWRANQEVAAFDDEVKLTITSCCQMELFIAWRMDGQYPEMFEPLPTPPVRKAPARVISLGAEEGLVDEFTAASYLNIKPITALRMARRGLLPSVHFPIGATGKIRHKFRLSTLKAWTDSLHRGA
jgi:hypothetical protein